MPSRTLKMLLSLGAIVLIVLRFRWPDLKIDAVTLGLLIVALLPWFFSFLESAEFPGGWKVKFRELRGVIQQQEQQIESQQEIINQLVIFSMSQPIYEKLRAIYYSKQNDGEYIYQGEYEDTNRRELPNVRLFIGDPPETMPCTMVDDQTNPCTGGRRWIEILLSSPCSGW